MRFVSTIVLSCAALAAFAQQPKGTGAARSDFNLARF